MATKSKANYIINAKGRKTAIVLPISEFDAMVRELRISATLSTSTRQKPPLKGLSI